MDSLCGSFNERDDFNRKAIAENLIKLLTSNDINISPMVIDGGWGTGKSEFCLKTISLIKDSYRHDYHVVYVDAFKSDHTGEPLLSLLGEIISTCCPEQKQNDFIDKMGKAAGFLLKKVSKAAIHYVVKESCDDLHDEFQEALSDTSDSIIDYSVNALLKDQVESEKKLKTLQDSLIEISNDKKIIIFIDELDRCRPDYAIDMLETIKHVFNIDKIKIVLVANIEQLTVAINHRYGNNVVSTHKYLEKFIKYKVNLPQILHSNTGRVSSSLRYFNYLIRKSILLNEAWGTLSQKVEELLSELIEIHNISLRQIERLVLSLEVYKSSYQDSCVVNYEWNECLILFCHLLYSLNPDLANKIKYKKFEDDELAKFLGLYSDSTKEFKYSAMSSLKAREALFLVFLNFCNSGYKKYTTYNQEIFIDLFLRQFYYNYPPSVSSPFDPSRFDEFIMEMDKLSLNFS